jgi:hypothetical protein
MRQYVLFTPRDKPTGKSNALYTANHTAIADYYEGAFAFNWQLSKPKRSTVPPAH